MSTICFDFNILTTMNVYYYLMSLSSIVSRSGCGWGLGALVGCGCGMGCGVGAVRLQNTPNQFTEVIALSPSGTISVTNYLRGLCLNLRPGPLFTKRTDVLPQDLAKSWKQRDSGLDLLPPAAIGPTGIIVVHCVRPPVRPSVRLPVCPPVRPERRSRSNSLRITAIDLKLGGMMHSTMKHIAI